MTETIPWYPTFGTWLLLKYIRRVRAKAGLVVIFIGLLKLSSSFHIRRQIWFIVAVVKLVFATIRVPLLEKVTF